MIRPLRLPFAAVAVFLLGVFATSAAHAQNHVKASLVAAQTAIEPGKPFTVALRLEHEEHWHTYWIEAGTGYPTSLTWKLPPGWTAGEIQWPVPILIKDGKGNVVGNGYEGTAYLPVTLTPPASLKPGETIRLAAGAEWLMCKDVCIPGDATVELSLPVAASAADVKPSPAAAEIATLAQPQAPAAGVKVAANRAAKQVTLTLEGPGAGAAELKDPHFFSQDAFIQYDQPQTATPSGAGLALTLPIADAAEAGTARLLGVLAYTDAAGKRQGWRIDTPFTGGAAAGAGNGTGNGAPGASSGTGGGAASTSAGATAATPVSLPGTLALAFVGGLILNLMPCVFPVLGIKILGFVNQAGSNRRKVTLHGVAFTVGVLLSFWALAGVLAVLRAGGDQLGWGFQLQSAPFVFGLAAVMLVFALSMSGVFEFGLRATGVGTNLQRKEGYSGSFFTGVLATVVATPCSAPFLAPALGAALALPTAQSFAVFTAIAVGLSTPYLLLSVFPQAVKVLPRPGAWMETFKQVMAFPLYASVAYLVWVLASQTTEYGLLYALLGLTLIAMATWVYGRYYTYGAKPARARFGLIATLALLSLGAWTGYPEKPAPTDVVWDKWSPEAIAKATAAGKTVYVDFTARWCFTCQTNKKVVFSSDEVKRTFRDKGVVLLKADWTNSDPAITAELAKWNRSAVPFNLVYKPGQPDPVVLPELLTPAVVLDAVKGS